MAAPWKPYTGDGTAWTAQPGYVAIFCKETPPRHHFCVAKDCSCECHGARS